MDIQKKIEETLQNLESENDHVKANAFLRTELYRIEWLTHQQSIISQQRQEIERVVAELEDRIKKVEDTRHEYPYTKTGTVQDGQVWGLNYAIGELKEILANDKA